MSQRAFQTLFIVVCVAAFIPVMFPVFELANSGTPVVAGLPFGFFWVVLWVVIVAVCAVVLYRIDPENRNGEEE
ncbi:MAG: DUF3311 domain-containing protein [Actinomycetia bacterium]|nr:DUF3311 domain-containing protein [Actinomycetes bacterium]